MGPTALSTGNDAWFDASKVQTVAQGAARGECIIELNQQTEILAYVYLLFLGVVTAVCATFDGHPGISMVLGIAYITVSVRSMVRIRRTTRQELQPQRIRR